MNTEAAFQLVALKLDRTPMDPNERLAVLESLIELARSAGLHSWEQSTSRVVVALREAERRQMEFSTLLNAANS